MKNAPNKCALRVFTSKSKTSFLIICSFFRLCKPHYCNYVRLFLSKDFKDLYRYAEEAYSKLDFEGKGYIKKQDLINSLVISRRLIAGTFLKEDIEAFMQEFNLFLGSNGSMNFDTFKKTFFAHMHHTFNIAEAMKEYSGKTLDNEATKYTQENQKTRLKKLDLYLKDRFMNNWVSVRKAFLDLDTDHDGFITVEDIVRYFGSDTDYSYSDLKKLITNKDTEKHQGLLNYQDFSKWVGNYIHSVQGFYFRHDSEKNPAYEKSILKYAETLGPYKETLSKKMIGQDDTIKVIMDKIASQWKTIRKSFHDLSKDQSGAIEPKELKFYFNHWGIHMNDETFIKICDDLDYDKDGVISYKDFQRTIGREIHPGEGLYFRQEKDSTMFRMDTCKHPKCWQATKQTNKFCQFHIKVNLDQTHQFIMRIYSHIGNKWSKFLNEVRKRASNDGKEIKISVLVKMLNLRYKLKPPVSNEEFQNFIDSYSGSDQEERKLVNISALYKIKNLTEISNSYKYKDDVNDSLTDGDDVGAADLNGYIGEARRPYEKLEPLSQQQITNVLSNSEHDFVKVLKTIRTIDRESNGYLTVTELDDILKINYPQQFKGKNLSSFIKLFRSIQNKILVDYRKMKEHVVTQMKKQQNFSLLKIEQPRIESLKQLESPSIMFQSKAKLELNKSLDFDRSLSSLDKMPKRIDFNTCDQSKNDLHLEDQSLIKHDQSQQVLHKRNSLIDRSFRLGRTTIGFEQIKSSKNKELSPQNFDADQIMSQLQRKIDARRKSETFKPRILTRNVFKDQLNQSVDLNLNKTYLGQTTLPQTGIQTTTKLNRQTLLEIFKSNNTDYGKRTQNSIKAQMNKTLENNLKKFINAKIVSKNAEQKNNLNQTVNDSVSPLRYINQISPFQKVSPNRIENSMSNPINYSTSNLKEQKSSDIESIQNKLAHQIKQFRKEIQKDAKAVDRFRKTLKVGYGLGVSENLLAKIINT